MKCIVRAAVVAPAVAWSMVCAAPLMAQVQIPPNLKNPQVEISYVMPTNPAFRPIFDRVTKEKALEELQAFLAPLKLPQKLVVKIDQCGVPVLRNPPKGTATICYEYIDQ